MKIIDLLNKIANGDIPKKIKYKDLEYRACGNGISGFTDYVNDDDRYCFSAYIGVKNLNDEVEIIEEKKIPEKLEGYDFDDSLDTNTKCEYLSSELDKENLESKGE